jgi:predicted PurR-regulated permease PerM
MQGFTSAALLTIAGMPIELFLFWFILLTVFSFIPMGAGIITIPIGVIMILTGDIWQGIVVIAGHLLITTNIDNVMRPRLVPKEAKLDPALTILSVFAGVALFGFLGIVIGPVIMIVVVTTLAVFLDVYRNMTVVEEKRKPKKQTLFNRVKGGVKKFQDSI